MCGLALRGSFRSVVASTLLFCCGALAQTPALRDPTMQRESLDQSLSSYRTSAGTAVLVFSVYAEKAGGHLDRQAVLRLVNVATHIATVSITDDSSRGVFTEVPLGIYELEVSAVGFLSEHRRLQAIDATRRLESDIVLQRDPMAVNLDIATSILSPKARKDAKHAISSLKSGNLTAAQKQLDLAYKQSPSNPDLNFLLGYLYFEKKDFQQAGTFLGNAVSLNPGNGQALTLLGRTDLERKDYPAARSALEKAVLTDADNWLSHDLLADTYLHQKDYGKARNEAQVAIAKGKTLASPAELVLGQAELGLGHNQEGIQALNVFLEQSPKHPLAGQVRTLISEINDRKSSHNNADNAASENPPDVDALAALDAPALPTKPWAPPDVDEANPPLASGAECPAGQVIAEAGKRVQELVEDLSRFAAVEDLLHQPLDAYGVPLRTDTRKYDYVASFSTRTNGLVMIDEYRSDKLSLAGYPDEIASTGFITLALVFHPEMQNDFDLVCEGLGDWRGQASWLVHFRQRADRPNHMHTYKMGEQIYPVDLKGRAWITADKFQIVRIEADMIKPMPEIRLLSEHQSVEYGPIPFPNRKTVLWLPKTAEIYFDFRKHHYYRRHSFDHYMLFSVDAEEKTKGPKS
jgi:tetratricopeptide (TPR) repeat protein